MYGDCVSAKVGKVRPELRQRAEARHPHDCVCRGAPIALMMRCKPMPTEKASMPATFLRRALIVFSAALWSSALWLPAHAGSEDTFDDTASCIAVMQTNADDLARQIKAGDKDREPALQTELRRAGALIGRSYLDGLHDGNEAKALLKAAQERLAAWDEERKKSVHQACLKRADAELAAASGTERVFVERFAQARLKRMLEAH